MQNLTCRSKRIIKLVGGNKAFISKEDLRILLSGLSNYQIDKIFTEIRKKAVEDISKAGKIIPDKRLVPTKYALNYIKIYLQ